MTKKCPNCKIEKDYSEFRIDRSKNPPLNTYCKICHVVRNKMLSDKKGGYNSKYCKEWRETRKRSERDKKLKNNYGITINDYDKMFKEQNGCCFICQKTNTDRVLAVDHCHTTGKVRGLLCGNCNNGLGRFKDNVESLKKAIEYLTRDN